MSWWYCSLIISLILINIISSSIVTFGSDTYNLTEFNGDLLNLTLPNLGLHHFYKHTHQTSSKEKEEYNGKYSTLFYPILPFSLFTLYVYVNILTYLLL